MQPLSEAERQILEDHYPLILGVARKIAPSWWEWAASIGATGAIKAIRSHRPDGGQPLRKWIAHNIAFEIRRAISRGKAPFAMPPLTDDEEPIDHRADDIEAVDDADEIAAMRAKIDALPEPVRTAVFTYLEEGGIESAAAARLGWQTWRLVDTLARARRLLGVGSPIESVLGGLTVAEAAESRGLGRGVVASRLEAGWSLEEALETPAGKRGATAA